MLAAPASTDINPLLARESTSDLVADSPQQARQLASSAGRRVLILSSLTTTTSTYANPDGSYSYLTHDGLVRLPVTGGGWAPIDTLLQPVTGDRVGAGMNLGHVTFSKGGTDRTLATASPADTTTPLSLLWSSDLPTGLTVGSTTTYPQVRPGVDLVQKALPNGFEFSFRLLTRPSGPVSFTLPLHLPTGWTAEQDGDAVVLRDPSGQQAGSVGGTHSYGLVSTLTGGQLGKVSTTTTHLEQSDDGPVLVVAPDANFLADPTTLYPVTVDPQISLADTTADTTVDQGQPDNNFGSAIDLIAGGYGTSPTYIRRSYLNFDTSGIKNVTPANVISASIGIVPEVTGNCTNFTVEVWNSAGLVSSATTFRNQPGGFTSHWSNITLQNIGSGCSGGQVQTSADMTAAAKAWAGNNVSQYAIILKTTNETNTSTWAKLFSANYSGQHPYIGVIYNGPPFPVGGLTATAGTNKCTLTWAEDGSNSYPSSTEYRAEEWIGSTHVTSADQHLAIANPQSATFTGLNPSTTYTFKIYETNAYGDSTPTSINCQPGGSVPTAPQNVTASAADASVTGTWAAPANDGTTAAVTGYSVQLQTAAGTNVGSAVNLGAGSRSYTFDASHAPTPVNGTSYRVAVTAQAAAGNSPAAYSGAATPAGVPPAPTLNGVSEPAGLVHPGTTTMRVAFTLNGNAGSAIDYCRADALSGSTVVASGYGYGATCGGTIDIPGLAYNTTYTFRVAAHNGTSSNTAGNGTGWSAYSNTVNATTGQDGSIVKTLVGNPATAAIGDTLTYKITVTAPSSNPLIVSGVKDVLPAGLRAADSPAVQMSYGATCVSVNFSCTQTVQNVVVNNAAVPRNVLLFQTNGNPQAGDGLSIGAGQSFDFTFPVVVTGDNSGIAGLQNRLCQTLSNTAQLLDNYAGSASGTTGSTSAAVVATGCGAGLGTEPWWSYVHTAVGVQADAAVNVANGNLVVTATDGTAIQGHGHVAQVTRRVYNSQDTTLETLPGSIGKGWQLNLGMTDALADTGVTGDALRLPTVSDIASLVTNPLGITLVDRDGTRHSFTPRLLSTALNTSQATGPLAGAAPQVLTTASGRVGCIDVAYDPPAGVHLALWRYLSVASSNGSCDRSTWTMSGTNAPVVAGYAAIRPDRLRTEYDAAGQLLALTDPAGVSLVYSWNSLHQITSVAEGTATANGIATCSACRKTTFSYTASNGSAATTNGDLSSLAAAFGRAVTLDDVASMTVTDPAGRPTTYQFATSTLGGAYPAGVRLLTSVINPDDGQNGIRDRVDYHYQSENAQAQCGGDPGQLCNVIDERSHVTSFAYDRGSGGPLVGPARVSSVQDRRRDSHAGNGYTTLFGYNDNLGNTQTDVTTLAQGNGGSPANNDRVAAYGSIDSLGRVGVLTEGPSPLNTSSALHTTFYAWDTASSPCGGMTKADNDLCGLQRVGSAKPAGSDGTDTADEVSSYRYDDAGMVRQTVRTTGTVNLTTTHGYARQWAYTDGSTSSLVAESDAPDSSNPATPNAASVLYTLADLTSTVTPRGNANGAAQAAAYRTSYTVDNLPMAAPALTQAGGSCASSGAATGNTGLVCAVSSPYTGASGAATAVTKNTYDNYGAVLTRTDPNGHATSYTYYIDASQDLSGTTSAGGWLKRTTDATGAFVAFGYDAAGNVIRTWDRTATSDSNLPGESFPGTLTSPPSGSQGVAPHSDTSYGLGTFSNAAAHPWRWATSGSDNLGNTTSYTRDASGDVTSRTDARGNTTVMTYDEVGNLLSLLTPTNAARSPQAFQLYSYDAFSDRITSTDPAFAQANGATPSEAGRTSNVSSRTYYDAVGRATDAYTLRQTSTAASGPAGCLNTSGSGGLGDPAFPSSAIVCGSHTAYDSVDNIVWTRDASGAATSRSYDAAHRLVKVISPAVNTSVVAGTDTSRPVTGYVYDADGNVTTTCRPRQYTEYTSGCSDVATGDVTHNTVDAAGRTVQIKTYRSDTQPLTIPRVFDAVGNLIYTEDANGHYTSYSYDVLNRNTRRVTQSSSTSNVAAATFYDPSGSVIATTPPLTGATVSRVTGMRLDADHRAVDTVTGLQVNLPWTEQNPDASNRSAIRNAINSALDSNTASGTANTRTRRSYDAAGNIVAVYAPRAFTSSVPGYNDSSQPANSNARGGFSSNYMTRVNYDADNRPVTSWTARADGSVTDPLAGSLSGNEQAQCSADGPSDTGLPYYSGYPKLCRTNVTYDPDSRVLVTTLPTATTTRTARQISRSYTVDGLLAAVTTPAASDTTISGSTPVATSTVTASYDGAGRPLSRTDALGFTTSTSYSPAGTPVRIDPPTGPNGVNHWTEAGYTLDGQPNRAVAPRTATGTPNGTPTETDVTTKTYTADGLVAELDQPGATLSDTRRTTYVYDNAGNTLSVLSPGGNARDANNTSGTATVMTYTYDNLLASSTVPVNPDGSKTRKVTYGYDDAGRVTTTTNSTTTTGVGGATTAGTVRVSTYADNDRLLTETVAAAGNQTADARAYNYDADGNRTCQISINGSTSPGSCASPTAGANTVTATFYLDGLTRSVTETHGGSGGGTRTSSYSYDGSGAPIAWKQDTASGVGAGSTTSTVTRNDAGLPLSQNASNLGTTSWAFNNDGQPTSQTNPNGTTQTWAYNPTDDMLGDVGLRSAGSSSPDLAHWVYGYDEQGRIRTQSHQAKKTDGTTEPLTTYQYSYDPAGRLTSFVNGTATVTSSYDHDSDRLTNGTYTYTYNADDSIANVKNSANTLDVLGKTQVYDADGNLTDDGCSTLTYTGFDQTRTVTPKTGASTLDSLCSTSTMSYGYDPLGRQVTRGSTPAGPNPLTPGTLTNTQIYYAGSSSTAVGEVNSGGSSTTLDYTLSALGGSLAVTSTGSGATSQYLVDDGTGSVGVTTSSSGAAGCVLHYTPAGEATKDNTVTANKPTDNSCVSGSTVSDKQYRGERRDDQTGAYQLGARTYSPNRAGFTSPDTAAGPGGMGAASPVTDPLTANTYSYVNGDPVNLADPSGHRAVEDGPCTDYCSADDQRIFLLALSWHIDPYKNGYAAPVHGKNGLDHQIGAAIVDAKCAGRCDWGEPGFWSTDTLKVVGKAVSNIPSGLANGVSHAAQGVVNLPSTVADGYIDTYKLIRHPHSMTTKDLSHAPKVHVPDVPAVFNDPVSKSAYTVMDYTGQAATAVATGGAAGALSKGSAAADSAAVLTDTSDAATSASAASDAASTADAADTAATMSDAGGEGGSVATVENKPGVTRVGADNDAVHVADNTPRVPGVHDVVVHSNGESFIVGGQPASVADVAAAVRAPGSSWVPGMPVRLLSCNAACGPAYGLATELGVDVEASAGLVQLPWQPPYVLTSTKPFEVIESGAFS